MLFTNNDPIYSSHTLHPSSRTCAENQIKCSSLAPSSHHALIRDACITCGADVTREIFRLGWLCSEISAAVCPINSSANYLQTALDRWSESERLPELVPPGEQ